MVVVVESVAQQQAAAMQWGGATAGVCGDSGCWTAAGGLVFSDGNDGPPDFGSGCPLLVSGNAVFGAGPGVAGATGCG